MSRSDFGVRSLTVEPALRDVDLTAPAGAVTAVVGGDGAGKSTLLRTLAGGIGASADRRCSNVTVPCRAKRSLARRNFRRDKASALPLRAERGSVTRPAALSIGYVPTGSGFYPDLTVEENIRFAATAYRVRGDDLRRRSEEMLGRTDLASFPDRLAGDLSGGQRQKLALAMATLHEPALLVLDEPTTGIDPVSRAEMWRLIARFAADGTAVVVATSYLDEAERALSVLVLHDGSVLLSGRPDALAATTPGALIDMRQPLDPTLAWRVGRTWRQWIPPGRSDLLASVDLAGNHPVGARLSDAVIVATLKRPSASSKEVAA
ncbi:MAG: putative multidrug ABC transporter ATP-binding protein YbhF [Acidimicrobiales bacterium]|nr:putative multidrug ABC transporter ATP-binding protein YbhF [Acidimicrobiales bacterium]